MAILMGILTAVISAFIFIKLKNVKEGDKKAETQGKWFLCSLAVYLLFDIVAALIMKNHDISMLSSFSTLILINAMFLLAVIDFNHKIIPNKYVLGMIVIRFLLIIFDGVLSKNFVEIMLKSLIGMLIGFIVLGLTALVSGKNLGAGDVKMYAVIGFFTGGAEVLDVLIYSSVICAVTGLLLVALKKCNMKSLVPMAPFAFVGTVLYVFLGL